MAFAVFFASFPAVAEELAVGFVHGKDPPTVDPIYRFEREVLKGLNGDRTVVSRYVDIDTGKEAVFESVEYRGGELSRYVFKQRQIDEEGTLEVREGKAHYTLKKVDKDKGPGNYKTETAEEDMKKNTVVIDQMIELLRARWDSIMGGKDLEVELAVVSRKEAVGFKIFRNREETYNGVKAVVMEMKPQNFFISLFVSPLYLTFEASGQHRILEVNGRMPLKRFHDGDYSDIEGILKFNYAKQPARVAQ